MKTESRRSTILNDPTYRAEVGKLHELEKRLGRVKAEINELEAGKRITAADCGDNNPCTDDVCDGQGAWLSG